MNLQDTILLNQRIMGLIESKYLDPPSLWPRGPDRSYHNRLLADTIKAQRLLKRIGQGYDIKPS